MHIFNPSLRPPSGFKFTSQEKVLFEGQSIEKIATAVRLYRKRAKIPKGDPIREINDQLCARYPKMCRQVSDSKILASRIVDSTLDLLDEEAVRQSVPHDTVAARLATCMACPHKAKWLGQCAPCNDKLTKLIPRAAETHKPQATRPAELQGYGCDVVGDDLSLAVLFTQPTQTRVPATCWRKGDSK